MNLHSIPTGRGSPPSKTTSILGGVLNRPCEYFCSNAKFLVEMVSCRGDAKGVRSDPRQGPNTL